MQLVMFLDYIPKWTYFRSLLSVSLKNVLYQTLYFGLSVKPFLSFAKTRETYGRVFYRWILLRVVCLTRLWRIEGVQNKTAVFILSPIFFTYSFGSGVGNLMVVKNPHKFGKCQKKLSYCIGMILNRNLTLWTCVFFPPHDMETSNIYILTDSMKLDRLFQGMQIAYCVVHSKLENS